MGLTAQIIAATHTWQHLSMWRPEYDHDHHDCADKICPRCGYDPKTNTRLDDATAIKDGGFSCELCDDCWSTYDSGFHDAPTIEEEP